MPRGERLLPVYAGAFAALLAAASLAALPAAVRAPLALPLVVYFPGAALWSAVFPGQARTAETRVLAVALSLALTVLCGLALNLVGCLTPVAWAVALGGATVLAHLAARARAPAALSSLSDMRGTTPRGTTPPGPIRVGWIPVAFAGAALLAFASIGLARHGAEAQREYRYTEFWMVPAAGDHPSAATLGLTNAEQAAAAYQVDIRADGQLVDRWPPFTLQPGETRTMAIALPQAADGERVEAWLYRDGDRGSVYRKVWVAVPPAQFVADPAARDASATQTPGTAKARFPGKSPARLKPPTPGAIPGPDMTQLSGTVRALNQPSSPASTILGQTKE